MFGDGWGGDETGEGGRTDTALDVGPEREPRAAGRAAVSCFCTDLHNADGGEQDAEEASAKEGDDADLLEARHLQVPHQAEGKQHDCGQMSVICEAQVPRYLRVPM